MVIPKSGKNKRYELEDLSMNIVGDGSNLSTNGEDYNTKYEKLLKQYNLERKKSDYEKDMDEYGPRIKAAMDKIKEANKAASIKDTSRPARDAESMKGINTKVKTNGSGYAEAETNESTSTKNKATATKKRPSRMDEKGPNFKKRNSSASEKDKKKGGSGEAMITPKKPAETPKGGYEPENQDVKGSRSIQEKMNDFKAKGSLKIGEGKSTDELYSRQKGKSNLKGYKYGSLTIGDIANKGARGLNEGVMKVVRKSKTLSKINDAGNSVGKAINKWGKGVGEDINKWGKEKGKKINKWGRDHLGTA